VRQAACGQELRLRHRQLLFSLPFREKFPEGARECVLRREAWAHGFRPSQAGPRPTTRWAARFALISLVQEGIYTRHGSIVGQVWAFAVDGFLHLGVKPAVITVGLLLRCKLADAGAEGWVAVVMRWLPIFRGQRPARRLAAINMLYFKLAAQPRY
jgi:hypothetical protein